MAMLKDYTTICSSAPSEILALIALRARDQIIARNLDVIQSNLDLAQAFFSSRPDLFRWLPPQASSIAFPAWSGPGSVEAFCQALVDQQGVMVTPGSLFDAPGQHFRVGLGRRNFPEALQQVQAFIDRQA
jgi:aspartate/methionine/tyrosine aminotransferase